jgi:cytochrome c peroxidase
MKRWIAFCVAAGLSLATESPAANVAAMEQLGELLFFDKISSPASTMSCAACHAPAVGFTGPLSGVNAHGSVYPGAVPQRFGNRKPPSAAYATFSPIFHFDEDEGLFLGGNFWDGRATGEHLGNPAADQALGPFLNPVEQNNPSKLSVLQHVAASSYAWRWVDAWGEPISYDTPEQVDLNYDRIGLAIAAFEGSARVNQFSSKFDVFWANARAAGLDVADIDVSNWRSYERLGLARPEVQGLALFNDESRGKCALCHVLDPVVDALGNELPPLFTDFSYDNLGTPRNPQNPFYGMDEVYLDDGSPINPLGDAWIDPGLGGFLETHPDPVWSAMAAENRGKHKVPSLRNVAKAPRLKFVKAYLHNGVFTSLAEVVRFYNTRDVAAWPPPEVPENVNTEELGDLGLSAAEEALIVAFMRTLSDGFVTTVSEPIVAAALRLPEPRLTPNPMGRTTTIQYSLGAPGRVQLRVFDVAGRQVATVVDGVQAAGRYDVPLATEALPSGVYFVRVDAGGQVSTARAVVVH